MKRIEALTRAMVLATREAKKFHVHAAGRGTYTAMASALSGLVDDMILAELTTRDEVLRLVGGL